MLMCIYWNWTHQVPTCCFWNIRYTASSLGFQNSRAGVISYLWHWGNLAPAERQSPDLTGLSEAGEPPCPRFLCLPPHYSFMVSHKGHSWLLPRRAAAFCPVSFSPYSPPLSSLFLWLQSQEMMRDWRRNNDFNLRSAICRKGWSEALVNSGTSSVWSRAESLHNQGWFVKANFTCNWFRHLGTHRWNK